MSDYHMKKTELKRNPPSNCPYCGSDNIFVKTNAISIKPCSLYCINCGARGPVSKKIKDARILWNRREEMDNLEKLLTVAKKSFSNCFLALDSKGCLIFTIVMEGIPRVFYPQPGDIANPDEYIRDIKNA